MNKGFLQLHLRARALSAQRESRRKAQVFGVSIFSERIRSEFGGAWCRGLGDLCFSI
jgi:hypothetical protein